jgi:Preprotein translocase subunit SecY
MFLMWLGEQITSRGIGNGISLIILSGIVAELPSAIANMLELGRQGALSTGLILVVIVMAVGVIAFIVFMERAQRRLADPVSPSVRSATACSRDNPRTCRSSSTPPASSRRSSHPRCFCCRRQWRTSTPASCPIG